MEPSHSDATEMEVRHDPDARAKVHEMIGKAQFAMMGTYDAAGACHSRPMVAVEHGGGELWFFTQSDSRKVSELRRDSRVLLDYADGDAQNYVSLVGRAMVTEDRERAKELWSEPLRTWFPDGPEDDRIALIRVDVESAEFWDSPSSAMVHAYGYVKARLTGAPPAPGEVGHVAM
jgi:general stress protein 26